VELTSIGLLDYFHAVRLPLLDSDMLNVVRSQRWLGVLGFTLLLPCFTVSAQSSIPQFTRVDTSEANIRLDGFVDEAVWQDLPVIDGMKVINPDNPG
jgi:hypothetical protein